MLIIEIISGALKFMKLQRKRKKAQIKASTKVKYCMQSGGCTDNPKTR